MASDLQQQQMLMMQAMAQQMAMPQQTIAQLVTAPAADELAQPVADAPEEARAATMPAATSLPAVPMLPVMQCISPGLPGMLQGMAGMAGMAGMTGMAGMPGMPGMPAATMAGMGGMGSMCGMVGMQAACMQAAYMSALMGGMGGMAGMGDMGSMGGMGTMGSAALPNMAGALSDTAPACAPKPASACKPGGSLLDRIRSERAVQGERNRLPGDWDCPSCMHHCFASKFECFKCGTHKPASAGKGGVSVRSGSAGKPASAGKGHDRLPGDWDCPTCGHHCFARSSQCFKCSTLKPEGAGKGGDFDFFDHSKLPGDWDCPSCGHHCFASKAECFKCGAAKPGSSKKRRRET